MLYKPRFYDNIYIERSDKFRVRDTQGFSDRIHFGQYIGFDGLSRVKALQ